MFCELGTAKAQNIVRMGRCGPVVRCSADEQMDPSSSTPRFTILFKSCVDFEKKREGGFFVLFVHQFPIND